VCVLHGSASNFNVSFTVLSRAIVSSKHLDVHNYKVSRNVTINEGNESKSTR